jgi:hypothetical protein
MNVQPSGNTIELQNGGWIVDEDTKQSLVYRKEFGAPTFRVPYQLVDDVYVLQCTTEIASANGDPKLINGDDAEPIIHELTSQLKKLGISVRVED